MISSSFAEKNGAFVPVSSDSLEKTFKSSKLVWVDFEPVSSKDIEFVEKFVNLHPLTVEAIFAQNKRPKYQEFDEYVFLVFYGVEFNNGKVTPLEFDVVLGKNFLFSFHSKPIESIKSVVKDISENKLSLKKGPDYLLYSLLDTIIDNLYLVVDRLNGLIDEAEDEIFSGAPNSKFLRKLFRLKRNVVSFRKIIFPQRETLGFLYKREGNFVDKADSIYFRDLSDHIITLSEFIDNQRDMVSDAFDAYLSVISNRLNEIMKVLTIIATIILPMSLVAGYFGMNVEFFEYGVFGKEGTQLLALVLILLIAVVMLYWFRKKKWI